MAPKQVDSGCIIVRKDDFETELEGKRHSMSWSNILKITAFKMDLLTADLICLEIESGDGMAILVNEEMAGFNTLVKFLQETFKDINVGWWNAVAKNPFQANTMVIWQRESPSRPANQSN